MGIENLIQFIADFVKNQGTLVQEENFEQVPVHHLTKRDLNVDGDVVLYIGADGLHCESGSKYLYTELEDSEVLDVFEYLGGEVITKKCSLCTHIEFYEGEEDFYQGEMHGLPEGDVCAKCIDQR